MVKEIETEEQEERKVARKPTELLKVVEVTKETERAIQLPDGEIVSFLDYLVWLGNKIVRIEKAL